MSDNPQKTPENIPAKKSQEIIGTTIESISGETISISESGVGAIQAVNLNAHISALGQVEGQQNTIGESVAVHMRSNQASVTNSGVGVLTGNEIQLEGGGAGVVIGQNVTFTNSRNGVVIAREVNSKRAHSLLLIAGKVNAPVDTFIDQRGIALMGVVTGVTLGAIMLLARLFRNKNNWAKA